MPHDPKNTSEKSFPEDQTPHMRKKAQRKEARKDLSLPQEGLVVGLATFATGIGTAATLSIPDQVMAATNSSKAVTSAPSAKSGGSTRGYVVGAAAMGALGSFRKTIVSASIASSNKVGAKRADEYTREVIEPARQSEIVRENRENEKLPVKVSFGVQALVTGATIGGFAVAETAITGKSSADVMHKRIKELDPSHVIPDMKNRTLRERTKYRLVAAPVKIVKNSLQSAVYPIQKMLYQGLKDRNCSDNTAWTFSLVGAGALTGPAANIGSSMSQWQIEKMHPETLKTPSATTLLKEQIAKHGGTTAFCKKMLAGRPGRLAAMYAGAAAAVVPMIEEMVEGCLDRTVVPVLSRSASKPSLFTSQPSPQAGEAGGSADNTPADIEKPSSSPRGPKL